MTMAATLSSTSQPYSATSSLALHPSIVQVPTTAPLSASSILQTLRSASSSRTSCARLAIHARTSLAHRCLSPHPLPRTQTVQAAKQLPELQEQTPEAWTRVPRSCAL